MKLLLSRLKPVKDKSSRMTTEEIHKKLHDLIKIKVGWDDNWTKEELPSEFKQASLTTVSKELKRIHIGLGWECDSATPRGYYVIYDDQTKPTRAQVALDPVIKLKRNRRSPRDLPYTPPPPKPEKSVRELSDSPLYTVKRSSMGWSAWTKVDVKAKQRLTQYDGDIISQETLKERQKDYVRDQKSIVHVYLGEHTETCKVLDAHCAPGGRIFEEDENPGRYFNHRPDNPNCRLVRGKKNKFYLETRRPVLKNIQLFWNYNDTITKGEDRPEWLDKNKSKY